MIRSLTKLPARRVSVAAVIMVVLGAVAGAWAYFTSTGLGTAQASVGSLSAPTITSATAGAGTASLSWGTVSPPAGSAAAKYFVIRDGGAPAGTCPTSVATATTATSCVDSGLRAGQHSYKVVAVWQSWTATSAATSVTLASGAASSIAVVSGSGQSATVHTAFANQLVAIVKDADGNPVQGVSVTFTAPSSGASGTFANGTATTTAISDASGDSTSTALNANTTAGLYTVTASANGISGGAGFSETNEPGSPATVSTASGSGQATTVNTTFSNPLVAQVTDAYGNPVPDASVSFAAPASGASASFAAATATTDSNGQASSGTVTANTAAGSYPVTASVTGATSSSFSLANNAGTAATVAVVSGSGQSATVGKAFSSPLVAKVTDVYGNAVPNATVAFTAPSSGASASLAAATATTDSSGQASSGTVTANSTAGSYTVTASSTGAGTSASFSLTNVSNAPATVAVVSGSGQSATVGMPFGSALVAEVTDSGGNPVPGATVTFTAPSTGASGTFANGTATTTATTGSDGQATASTFTASGTAGSYTVAASVSGATPANFGLTNTAGTAAAVAVVSGSPQSTTVGSPFSSALVAKVTDASGNPISGVTVTFTAPSSGASGTFVNGTATTTATTGSDGQATASTFTANTTAGSYAVTAAASGASSASFSLANGAGPAAAVSVVSGSGQSAPVASAFGAALVARVVDSYGNPVSGASVTFTAPSTGPSAAFAGSTTTSATTGSNGQASSGTITAGTVAGSYSVSASVVGATATNFSLTNTAGAANTIAVVSGSPQSVQVGTAFASLVAKVTDSYGNPVSGASVTFTAPSSGASGTFANGTGTTTATTATDGQANASTFTANITAGSYTVAASVSGVANPANFALTSSPATASKLVFTSQPASGANVSAGAATAFGVSVEDQYGNVETGDSATTVTLAVGSGSQSGTLSCTNAGATTATVAAGVASFSCSLNKAGSYTLTATSNPAHGSATSNSFIVVAGTPATVAVSSGSGQSAAINAPFSNALVARVTDSSGNPVSGVSVTFSAPSSGPSGKFANGTTTTTATTNSSGLATASTFTASSATGSYSVSAAASGATSASFGLTNYGSAAKLVFTQQPAGAAAGSVFLTQPVVAVEDSNGDIVASSASAVSLTLNPATGQSGTNPQLKSCSSTTTNGIAAFSGCNITQFGQGFTLSASATGLSSATSTSFNVSGSATQMVFTTQPDGSATGGLPFPSQPVVTLEDQFGNVAYGDTHTVTLAITGGTGTSGAALSGCAQTETNGIVTFSGCSIDKTGNGYTLTASDGGQISSTTSNPFNVGVGSAVQLMLSATTSTPTAGAADILTVTAVDAGGNTVTGYTGSHNLTFSGANNAPDGTSPTVSDSAGTAQPFGTSTAINFTNGQATVSGSANGAMKLYNAGNASIVVTDGTLSNGSALSVTVSPAAANKVAFTTQPDGSATGGLAFPQQPKVAVQDQYGNTVTTSTATVTLAIGNNPSGGTLSGCTSTRSSGVTTFSGCKIDKAGSGYTLTATATGVSGATSNSFDVGVGPAAKLIFTTQPDGSATGGLAFPQQPVVTVQDAGGNTVTTDSSGVTLAIASGTAGASFNCASNPLAASGGVATFSGCKIDKSGAYTLKATDGSLTSATSNSFTISVGPPAKLAFTQQPTGATAGSPLATQPAVTVQDAGGNTVTSDTSKVTLAISSGTGNSGGALTCTTNPVTAGSGVASFSGCQIDTAGIGYTLAATDGQLTAATSNSFNVTPGISVTAPASDTTNTTIAASAISSTLSGAASTAGGTITFKVFGPQTTAPTTCTSGGTTVGSAVSVSGNGTYHPSANFTPSSAGTYWWYASYSGDANNPASSTTCGTGMPAMTSTDVNNATTTTASGPAIANVGSAIATSAIGSTLSGATTGAGGTITFKVFGPQTTAPTTCTSGGTTVGTASASGSGAYHPNASFTPSGVGTYWWYASYSGDANNNASASTCGSGMAQTLVYSSVASVHTSGTGSSAATGTFTVQPNTTYLLFAFRHSSSGDSVTSITSTNSALQTWTPVTSQNFNSSADYQWAYQVTTGSSASGSATLTMNFTLATSQQTIVDVVALGSNNTTTPIVTTNEGLTTQTSAAPTANFPSAPDAADAEVVFLGGNTTLGGSAPTATGLTSLFYSGQSSGSAGVYAGNPAQQNSSFSPITSQPWGSIALEIAHS